MRQRGKHKAGRTKEGGHTKQTLFITQITTDDSLATLAADKESLHLGVDAETIRAAGKKV
jgi:hypothetical protein